MMNVKAIERLALAGTIDPATVVNSEVFTDVVDVSKYNQVVGICLLGNMSSETIDFKCYRCAANGSSAVALKSAAQLGASASANDNTQLMINVRSDDLIAAGAQYVKFGLVTGNSSGGPAAVVALGVDPRFGPATHLASVQEAVA